MILRRLAPAVLAAALLAGCSPTATAPAPGAGVQVTKSSLNAAEFKAYAAQTGVKLIDVRTPAEFAAGHLEGAQLIDFEASDFDATFGALPKDGTYALYCRSGNRSGQALARLKAAGYTKIADLSGGIGAWQAAGYPFVK